MQWYAQNGRDLPWRKTADPYAVWVSEIILQQTRVNQGMQYYYNFLSKFPTVSHLAHAEPDQLLKVWEGLGYYSRAINMQKSAAIIFQNYGANSPTTYEEWLELPGVGPYTAAAIVSAAFNHPVAAIDTNGYRVISRLFAVNSDIPEAQRKKRVQSIADSLLDLANPGQFNQALMDFGAMVCRPKNPLCTQCIFGSDCVAFQQGATDKYPQKTRQSNIRKRFFYYFKILLVDNCGNEKLLVCQRQKPDIWRYLYELPMIEADKECSIDEIMQLTQKSEWVGLLPFLDMGVFGKPIRHKLTHQLLEARLIMGKLPHSDLAKVTNPFCWVTFEAFELLPKHRLISKLMSNKRGD